MSYANRKQLEQNRTLSIIFSALITFAIGFALISGLASSFVKKAAEDLKTFDVEQEPPPPEEPPPPPDTLPPPPMVSAPPPLVRFDSPPLQIQTTPQIQPPMPPTPIAAPPAPPAPPVPRVSQAARAKGNLATLIRNEDYPDSAIEQGVTGTARARLEVGANGRVTGCTITQSTGNAALDRTVCRVLQSRGRFDPAKDQTGNPIGDTVNTPPIRFEISG